MHLHIIPRRVAIERGLTHYFTGKPCKRNGVSLRSTLKSQCLCSECLVAVSEIKQLSAERNADGIRRRQAEYREANRELISARNRERYATNPSVGLKLKEWQLRNPEKKKAYQLKWNESNPEAVTAKSLRRRARVLNAEGSFDAEDIRRLLELQRGRCACCGVKLRLSGKSKFHIDHIIALAKGGTNWPDNLQLLCPPCNRKKSDKDPYDFAAEMGRLF